MRYDGGEGGREEEMMDLDLDLSEEKISLRMMYEVLKLGSSNSRSRRVHLGGGATSLDHIYFK